MFLTNSYGVIAFANTNGAMAPCHLAGDANRLDEAHLALLIMIAISAQQMYPVFGGGGGRRLAPSRTLAPDLPSMHACRWTRGGPQTFGNVARNWRNAYRWLNFRKAIRLR